MEFLVSVTKHLLLATSGDFETDGSSDSLTAVFQVHKRKIYILRVTEVVFRVY